MDSTVVSNAFTVDLWNGVLSFLGYVNWLYVVAFMLSAWIFNDTIDSANPGTRWADFLKGFPKILRSLAVGILWILIFWWGFKYGSRGEVLALVFSMLLSSFLYQIGLNKVFRWVSSKLGFKFE
jgi:hypothetical protein